MIATNTAVIAIIANQNQLSSVQSDASADGFVAEPMPKPAPPITNPSQISALCDRTKRSLPKVMCQAANAVSIGMPGICHGLRATRALNNFGAAMNETAVSWTQG